MIVLWKLQELNQVYRAYKVDVTPIQSFSVFTDTTNCSHLVITYTRHKTEDLCFETQRKICWLKDIGWSRPVQTNIEDNNDNKRRGIHRIKIPI